MEEKFANWNFVPGGGSIIGIAAGRLSRFKGEGEGEASSTTGSQRSRLNPSPQSSPLAARGEAKRSKLVASLVPKCSCRAAQNENRCDR
jgi:hypothetical protein